jgi:hypothetical protein
VSVEWLPVGVLPSAVPPPPGSHQACGQLREVHAGVGMMIPTTSQTSLPSNHMEEVGDAMRMRGDGTGYQTPAPQWSGLSPIHVPTEVGIHAGFPGSLPQQTYRRRARPEG